MKKPPSALQPAIAFASRPDAAIDAFVEVLSRIDPKLLERHAHSVIGAIADPQSSRGMLKCAAVHHVLMSDPSVIAMVVDTCIRGPMSDADACEAVGYLLDHGWAVARVGNLLGACATGKADCAKRLVAHGAYRQPANWAHLIREMASGRELEMTQMLVETAKPPQEDLLVLRLAVTEGSPSSRYLDHLLQQVVVENESKRRH